MNGLNTVNIIQNNMIQHHQYQLAKRGKWICPECGHKTFVCYVDANGQVLNERVGKCDRADKCAYHYPPREYFADNKIVFDAKQHRPSRPMFRPQPRPSYIHPDVFKQSVTATMSHRNHLITYLNGVFGEELVSKMITDYYIGTSKHWESSTVFWQIDRFGHIHGGKIMQYNPDNGKRVKEPHNRITWVHTAMKMPDYNLRQCLFGEHLLSKYPDRIVALFESEKTAIIASTIFGDTITLACGGCGNLTPAMCEPLRGRDVVLFPDNGKFDEWGKKGEQMSKMFSSLRIANIMERVASRCGDDLGDLIVENCRLLAQCPDWVFPYRVIPTDFGLVDL